MIDFVKGKIGKIGKKLKRSFEKLPADKNEKSKGYYFRFRRFSKLHILKDKTRLIKNTSFFQNKKTNRFAGGKIRNFKSINKDILEEFSKIFRKNFYKYFDKNRTLEVGFHQLRIKCSKNFVGYPVPEGWHKDGFDYVGIINFDSQGIIGGTTRIKTKINSSSDIFSSFLSSGEYILISDKKYFHYTDPININNSFEHGHRDTLVITVSVSK
jgi:hypothetical protein